MTFDEDALRAALRDAPSPTSRSDLAQTAIARGAQIRFRRRVGAIAGGSVAAVLLGAAALQGLGLGTLAVPGPRPPQNPIYAPSLGGSASPTPGLTAPAGKPGSPSTPGGSPAPGTSAEAGGGATAGKTTTAGVIAGGSTTGGATVGAPSTGTPGAPPVPSSPTATASTAEPGGASSSARTPSRTGSPTPSRPTATPSAQPMTLRSFTLLDSSSCLGPDEWNMTTQNETVVRLDREDERAWMTCGNGDGRSGSFDDAVHSYRVGLLSEEVALFRDRSNESEGTFVLAGTKIDRTMPGSPEVVVYEFGRITTSGRVVSRWQFPVAERSLVADEMDEAMAGLKLPPTADDFPPLTFPGDSPSGTPLKLTTMTSKGDTYSYSCPVPAQWEQVVIDPSSRTAKPGDDSGHVSCVLTESDPEAEIERRLKGASMYGNEVLGYESDDANRRVAWYTCNDTYCEYSVFRWSSDAVVEQNWEFPQSKMEELAATIAAADAKLQAPKLG